MLDGVSKGLFTCGERNGQAKLTASQVREIRTRYAAGGVFQRILAAEYGVDRALISYIVTGKSWAHLIVGSEPAPLDGGGDALVSASPLALEKP
jgi:hypothetical protein